MLKKIDGLWYMTGTSENSLYPVVIWNDDNGFHVGLRLEAQKPQGAPEGIHALALYMRVQFFGEDGSEKAFDYPIAAKYLHQMELKLASPKHMSSVVGSGIINTAEAGVDKVVTSFKNAYRGFVTKVAKKHYLTRLQDDALDQIIGDRFKELLGVSDAPAPKPIADVAKEEEAKLDELDKQLPADKPFDFKDMFGGKKFGG